MYEYNKIIHVSLHVYFASGNKCVMKIVIGLFSLCTSHAMNNLSRVHNRNILYI